MSGVVAVAVDLVREALSRKWILALVVVITAMLGLLSAGLSVDVVDGALAATRFFGDDLSGDIQAADVALRPLFRAASYVIFYGGLTFGILACSDFAPNLLSPGRIEHLLSMPLRRSALIGGTYVGVFAVMSAIALYGAIGFTVILGLKTGVWTPRLLGAALLAIVTFGAIYGVMVTAAIFVRSAAVSTVVGNGMFVAGIFSGYRDRLAPMFEPGLERAVFEAMCTIVPPISAIADEAGRLAGTEAVDAALLGQRLAGMFVFGVAAFAVGVWRFEQKDF
ncbi:hypothetical protein L6R52_12815 [Myxococcota bacterium]|nr:hypothetical protein [Myxococcota bacterium]